MVPLGGLEIGQQKLSEKEKMVSFAKK